METAFTLEEAPGIEFVLRSGGILGGPKILSRGKVLPKKKGKFVATLPNGEELRFGFKFAWDIFTPKVTIGDRVIEVVEPLPTFQGIWATAPLVMIAVGGAIGGLSGGIAALSNLKIFRSTLPMAAKYALSLLITLLAVLGWLVAAVWIQSALKH